METAAPLDYAAMSESVSEELKLLQKEKQALEETVRENQARLIEISQREVKLACLSDSINELLLIDRVSSQDSESAHGSVENLPSANSVSADISAAREIETEADKIDERLPDLQTASFRVAGDEQNLELETSDADALSEMRTETRSEFDKDDFLSVYPHLKGAKQPIYVLAEKVLSYMNRPLKLKELTLYILELGYRHSSTNFTNSVHNVLKHKRNHSGGFYFDPRERVWKLGYWRNRELDNVEEEKVLIPDSESGARDSTSGGSGKGKKVGGGEIAGSAANKKAVPRKIKVVKAPKR